MPPSSGVSRRPGPAAIFRWSPPESFTRPNSSARRLTCRPAGASWTSPPGAETWPSPRHGGGVRRVGTDFVPALLERGRIRAEAEHLAVEFVEGDAERLPFPDASFDAVVSIYGVMFAPDHKRAASELVRVCRPGARIALASWTPDGFIGETFKAFSRYLPPAPGLEPPVRWGDERYVESRFGSDALPIKTYRRTAVFRFGSAEENVEFFRTYYGPTFRAFESLDAPRREALRNDLLVLARRYDRNGGTGPIAITADYLETVIVRKQRFVVRYP